jgi:hypothetical protein
MPPGPGVYAPPGAPPGGLPPSSVPPLTPVGDRPPPRAPKEKESITTLRTKLVLNGLLAGIIGGAIPGVLKGILVGMIGGYGGGGAIGGTVVFLIYLGISIFNGALVGLFAGLTGGIDQGTAVGAGVLLYVVTGMAGRILMGMGFFALMGLMGDAIAGAIMGFMVYFVYSNWFQKL